MFHYTSRYYALPTATMVDQRGRTLAYKTRRFLPPLGAMQLLGEVAVAEGDRIDLIAARTMGASELFWMVCDANTEMHPERLGSQVGRQVRIPAPMTSEAVGKFGKVSP